MQQAYEVLFSKEIGILICIVLFGYATTLTL